MAWRFDGMDAADSAFFTRQLEQIRAKTYDKKVPNLLAREFVPVDNTVNPGAELVTYRSFEMIGMAKIVSNYATDVPRADVVAKEFTGRIKGILSSYGYSFQEARAAQYAGTPLDQKKADAARRSVEETIDSIGRVGDAEHGLIGFLNQPNAIVYTVPNGASGFATWTKKTGDEIVADMAGIAQNIVSLTRNIEIPDTLILPLTQYGLIATKRMDSVTNMTVLKFFLANNPYIKNVAPWEWLGGAGAAGSDRMVCYRRDLDALALVIPQEFEQLPPQYVGTEVVTICHARCGGVQCFYPLSISYGDGI